jgi:heme/copper-type cytochrome/quinol oxidase subunit 2
MTDPHVAFVAHHMILLAIPAFLPAIIVVGVILYVALKDRRSPGESEDAPSRTDESR